MDIDCEIALGWISLDLIDDNQKGNVSVVTINSVAAEKCGCNINENFLNSYKRYISWAFPVNLPPGVCHMTSLVISQHWLRWSLCALSNKPLHEPMMIKFYISIGRHWSQNVFKTETIETVHLPSALELTWWQAVVTPTPRLSYLPPSTARATDWRGDTEQRSSSSLQWRHDGRDGVSNHQRLLNPQFYVSGKRPMESRIKPPHLPGASFTNRGLAKPCS